MRVRVELLFIVLLCFSGCVKNNEVLDKAELPTENYNQRVINANEIPGLMTSINSELSVHKNFLNANSGSKTPFEIISINETNVQELFDVETGVTTYTFEVETERKLHTEFFNLVKRKYSDNTYSESYVWKYKMKNSFYNKLIRNQSNYSNFQGKLKRYKLAHNNSSNQNESKSIICDCPEVSSGNSGNDSGGSNSGGSSNNGTNDAGQLCEFVLVPFMCSQYMHWPWEFPCNAQIKPYWATIYYCNTQNQNFDDGCNEFCENPNATTGVIPPDMEYVPLEHKISLIKEYTEIIDSQFDGFLSQYPQTTDAIFSSIINGGTTDHVSEEISTILFNNLITSNSDFNELNEAFENAPAWLWPVIREIGIELVAELAKRQFKKFKMTDNVADALKAIPQGDLYSFLDNAKDILANFSAPIKLFDMLWDTGELGWKANKIIGQLGNMYNSIGTSIMDPIFKAMNRRSTNLLSSFDVEGGAQGLKLINKSIAELWEDLQIEFGGPSLTSDGGQGFFFEVGDIRINWYPNDSSFGNPAISIGNGNKTWYKFRTP